MDIRYISEEQVKRIKEYVFKKSKDTGKDIGESGYRDWIKKHARRFRIIADNLNDECIECGWCCNPKKGKKCIAPFNWRRRSILRRRYKRKR